MNIQTAVDNARDDMRVYRNVTEPQELEVRPSEMRAGDVLRDSGLVVEEVSKGRIKVGVRVKGRKTPLPLAPDEVHYVLRKCETEESKAAYRALCAQHDRLRFIAERSGGSDVESLRASLAKALESANWRRVAEAAIDLHVAEQAATAWDWVAAQVLAGKKTAAEGIAYVVEDYTERLVSNQSGSGWSGGHTVHNAMEQAVQAMWRKTIQDALWL